MSDPFLSGTPSVPAWPILIAGAGLAGLALALALRKSLGDAVAIRVCDPALAREPQDGRAYAVSAGARRLLQVLGVWPGIEPRTQAMHDMAVTDSRLADPVRAIFLTFAGEARPGEPFAHMLEAAPLARVLRQACAAAGIALDPVRVQDVETRPEGIVAALSDGSHQRAALLVACDGARSTLREQAGIGWVGWDYPQSGIVATITHERDHRGRAVQHFLPSGPFALLPLAPGGKLGHRTSIVWSERRDKVPGLLALPPEAALAEVESRFGLELGEIAMETGLTAFPLGFGLARSFVRNRFALVGDAAHRVHPLAGQGLNLGLADVAVLTEAIAEAVRLGLDPGSPETLRPYEANRRGAALAMGSVTDALNRLFSNDVLPVRLIRDLGLGLVDRVPALKRRFIREASGLSETGPRLLAGELP